MTASLDNLLAPPVATFLPPPTNLPSDIAPRADIYLAEKGIDSRRGACQYYLAIGAVKGCGSEGELVNPINYEQWQKAVKIGKYASGGARTFQAGYINKVDLNLSRVHQSVSYGPNQTAAVVCNHVGATNFFNPTQDDIDNAVESAVAGKNLVACVAMDYSITPGVNNNQPFVRFFTFGPSGDLLPSINLDARREKFLPGTCIACHGGDHYAGKFPADGSGFANVGAHFLPYDVGNFEFASKRGLQKCDQGGDLQPKQECAQCRTDRSRKRADCGWYSTKSTATCSATISHELNEEYVPVSWSSQSVTSVNFYKNVVARSCRTCHVAMTEGYNFYHYQNVAIGSYQLPGGSYDFDITACGAKAGNFQRFYTMPNSLVTFNRLLAFLPKYGRAARSSIVASTVLD